MVKTRTSFKATNTFSYVSMDSDLPQHTFRALLKGELLRIQRACSDPITASGDQVFIFSHFVSEDIQRVSLRKRRFRGYFCDALSRSEAAPSWSCDIIARWQAFQDVLENHGSGSAPDGLEEER